MRRWARAAALGAGLWVAMAGPGSARAGGEPTVFTSGTGRVEVIGPDARSAGAVVTMAREAWDQLAGVAELPAGGFEQAVIVRLVPAEAWNDAAWFRAVVEPGGLVSVRVRWDEALPAAVMRRALVQGLLLRRAVAWHGPQAGLRVPLWLEVGCVAWWVTRARPAVLDQWQQEAERAVAVEWRRLLAWERGDPEPRALELASLWLVSQLVQDGRRPPGWPELLRRILSGENEAQVLGWAQAERRGGGHEAELWWQVVQAHQRTSRALPLHRPAESRRWLGEAMRVVLAQAGRDVVLGPDEWWAARGEAALQTVLAERAARVGVELPRVHAFYYNAALALGAVMEAVRDGDGGKFARARAQLASDVAAGRELEDVAAEALDVVDRVGGWEGG